MIQKKLAIIVGARSSPLSKAQVKEVEDEIKKLAPNVFFEPLFVQTIGDLDKTTSLRGMEKTDFFTREIDRLLLEGKVRLGIHSAKDLPESLPSGLEIAAITQGVDPSDALVLRQGQTLQSLPKGAVIATSSIRREEAVRSMRGDFQFIDLRGTIHERLQKLEMGEADGVVVAEAALIRLGLKHLNRIAIPGETVPFQGRLAVACRSYDEEMLRLFSEIDVRQKV